MWAHPHIWQAPSALPAASHPPSPCRTAPFSQVLRDLHPNTHPMTQLCQAVLALQVRGHLLTGGVFCLCNAAPARLGLCICARSARYGKAHRRCSHARRSAAQRACLQLSCRHMHLGCSCRWIANLRPTTAPASTRASEHHFSVSHRLMWSCRPGRVVCLQCLPRIGSGCFEDGMKPV